MDIMELGAIGELVGGLAVLVTLLYLALQIRQSNQLERAESQRAWVRDWGPAIFSPLMDPHMANVIRRAGSNFDALSGDEQLMMTGWWAGLLLLTEEAGELRRQGLMEANFAQKAEERAVAILQQPGAATWWIDGQKAHTDHFVERMNTLLEDPNRPPPFHHLLPWFALRDDEQQREA